MGTDVSKQARALGFVPLQRNDYHSYCPPELLQRHDSSDARAIETKVQSISHKKIALRCAGLNAKHAATINHVVANRRNFATNGSTQLVPFSHKIVEVDLSNNEDFGASGLRALLLQYIRNSLLFFLAFIIENAVMIRIHSLLLNDYFNRVYLNNCL